MVTCYLLVYGLPFGNGKSGPHEGQPSATPARPMVAAVTLPPATSAPTPPPTIAPTSAPTAAPTKAPAATRADSRPILVNRQHSLPDDYRPENLVKLIDVCPSEVVKIKGKDIQGDAEAVNALIEMLRAAVAEGIGDWQISAGYRSIAYQQQLLDNKVAELMKSNGLSRANAKSAALKTVAPPGASEHHTGLAFDITVPGTSFAGTRQATWLAQHCYAFGYVLRYQEHKEKITGYIAEAWHFRYVGRKAAAAMQENDWCLEEYVDFLSSMD